MLTRISLTEKNGLFLRVEHAVLKRYAALQQR